MKRETLHLRHILECVDRIRSYTDGVRANYLGSLVVQDAVLRRLHILAESTQKLPEDLKERYPSIPWREISGFRNVIVHDYLGVDHEQIWKVVEVDLPPLAAGVQRILDELGVGDG